MTLSIFSQTPLSSNSNLNFFDQSFKTPPPQRMPSAEASVVSVGSGGFSITERYQSLLFQGGAKAVFQTPIELFSAISMQHVQMNFGIMNTLGVGSSYGKVGAQLGGQLFVRYPVMQRLFQNLLNSLKMAPNTIVQNMAPGSTSAQKNNSQIQSSHPDTALLTNSSLELERQIYTPEPEVKTKLDKLNQERVAKGKSPIQFQAITREIDSIMNNPSLSPKEKNKQVEALRKRLGLGKKEMKTLFTQRMGKIYEAQAKQIQTHLHHLKAEASEAERLYGKDSPQALSARQRLDQATQTLGPKLNEWKQNGSALNKMFKKRGFFSKLGGVFKKIGKGILNVAKPLAKIFNKVMALAGPVLSFIPGIGHAIKAGWGVLKGVAGAVTGGWKGFLTNMATALAQQIPGIGSLVAKASQWVSKVPALSSLISKIPKVGLPLSTVLSNKTTSNSKLS